MRPMSSRSRASAGRHDADLRVGDDAAVDAGPHVVTPHCERSSSSSMS